MKRRSFLTMLGLAPVAGAAVARPAELPCGMFDPREDDFGEYVRRSSISSKRPSRSAPEALVAVPPENELAPSSGISGVLLSSRQG